MTRLRRLGFLRTALLLALTVVAVALAAMAYHATAALRLALAYRDLAAQARRGDVASIDLQGLSAALPRDLAQLHGHLTGLRRWGAPALWVMQRSGGVPLVGADCAAVPHLLDAGIAMTAAAQRASALAQPALDALTSPAAVQQGGALATVLGVIAAQRAALDEARMQAAAALDAHQRIAIPALHGRIGTAARLLGEGAGLLDAGLAALAAAPAALGVGEPVTYLLVAQNSDELRASGGFVSAAGTISLDAGRVTHFDLRDSYAGDDLSVPHPEPPEALQRLMGAGVLLLRDVNWWPDFPTTARTTMHVWELDRKQQVDGVVALDEEGLRLIVEGLGELRVAGEATPIVAADLNDLLREKWGIVPEGRKEMGAWWRHRKDFLPVLAGSILDKVQAGLSSGEATGLARGLLRAIAGRHLQAYVSDAALQEAIVRAGAGGAIPAVPGDYLFVVDSNVGFNKVNAVIEQSIAYAVDLSNAERPQGSLAVTYTNHASIRLNECVLVAAYGVTYGDMMERCYWDYVRVYAPEGSTALLDAAAPAVETARESGKQVFAISLVTAPGDSETLRLRYALPFTVIRGDGGARRYTLLAQKQGGVTGHALRVSVTLPAGARLVSASPRPRVREGQTLIMDMLLDRDRTIEVVYAP